MEVGVSVGTKLEPLCSSLPVGCVKTQFSSHILGKHLLSLRCMDDLFDLDGSLP